MVDIDWQFLFFLMKHIEKEANKEEAQKLKDIEKRQKVESLHQQRMKSIRSQKIERQIENWLITWVYLF